MMGEPMAAFIGSQREESRRETPGRWWRWISMEASVLRTKRRGRESGQRQLDGGNEGDDLALRFSFNPARESGRR
jgi:hypothetical protein